MHLMLTEEKAPHITNSEITCIIVHESFIRQEPRMVNCPVCGKPLEKSLNGESKYYCQNMHCIVIFVRRPHKPEKMRIAYTSFMKKT
jgi:hypothetical protein